VGTASEIRDRIRTRVASERGTVHKDAPERVALLYPSPYFVGMSSLGFQTIYREINGRPGRVAERAFLPEEVSTHLERGTRLFTYESERPVADFPVVALSVAFEPELAGVIQVLELAGIPPLAEDRGPRHPFVLAGGPLTFSNPLPLAPFVDAILVGEADDTIHDALDVLFAGFDQAETLRRLREQVSGCYVPRLDGAATPPVAAVERERLPARSQIVTPETELRNMYLIEAERGCSRGCKYCVMRRSTAGGMRLVPMEKLLELIPEDESRVGLVGAAVSDHPRIVDIVESLADRGCTVGLSSLRPDRLHDRFAQAIRRAGYKTLTTALDGASQRLRDSIERRTSSEQLAEAARLAQGHGFKRLKLYLMLGLPGETDADVDELVAFSTDLSKIVPLSLGIAPFVSKRNTPLDGLPFAGIDVIEHRLKRLRRGVRGRVDIRATSARWAWVEYVLAQGGVREGRAVLDAVRSGGRFRDFKNAFDALPADRSKRALSVVD
jgi:radical SAM superfamily enzyme YgiQ (UPF0313 family)